MAVQHISIKQLSERINAAKNPWLLPAIQRLYAWGERYQSEKYMIRLFDSLMKDYPVGMLLVWNCDKAVPYREFCTDYEDGNIPKIVDAAKWKRADKFLVYDGQQRVQTIYSLIMHSVNERVLVYNFDKREFEFVDKNSTKSDEKLYLAELLTKSKREKAPYRDGIKNTFATVPATFEEDFDNLWFVFNDENAEKIPYFEMSANFTEAQVAEVFHRVNTTGLSLSATDILMSKIKEKQYDYEERLEEISVEIEQVAGGYKFPRNNILDIANLLSTGAAKINVNYLPAVDPFIPQLPLLQKAMKAFFGEFLHDEFRINSSKIISKGLALYPLIVYIYERIVKGKTTVAENNNDLLNMKKYFLLSQYNDWNTHGIAISCSRIAKDSISKGGVFPLSDIETFITNETNRKTGIDELNLLNWKLIWFTLKILMPQRAYSFAKVKGRYAPEIDHIFPKKLKPKPSIYSPDIIWNMQPVQGLKNNGKSNRNPHEYFTSIPAMKAHYDYMPIIDATGSWDMAHLLWNDPMAFIEERKKLIKATFATMYGITI